MDGASDSAHSDTVKYRTKLAELSHKLREAPTQQDGYLLFLHGMLLRKLGMRDQALDTLISSINACPGNWAAWLELAKCFSHHDQVSRYNSLLPTGVMQRFYLAHVAVEFHHGADDSQTHAKIDELMTLFPASAYLLAQRGLCYYNHRQYEEAEQVFRMLHLHDPESVDYMDVYSNILFVSDNHGELSVLAQACSRTDKYRPETCVVVGNYYGMKNLHEKAILYFQRAIALNASYLSAWTLLGHEYLEVNNAHAALEAYRRALDISHRDYRAWFGLGQTYEMLKMEYYALHYFQKAAELRPGDGRMWSALASVYDALGKKLDSIRCWRRALSDYRDLLEGNSDNLITDDCADEKIPYQDGLSLLQLAKMLEDTDQQQQARKTYLLFVKKCDHEEHSAANVASALKFLGRYATKHGAWESAEEYGKALLAMGGAEKEEGKALLGEIRLSRRNVV